MKDMRKLQAYHIQIPGNQEKMGGGRVKVWETEKIRS